MECNWKIFSCKKAYRSTFLWECCATRFPYVYLHSANIAPFWENVINNANCSKVFQKWNKIPLIIYPPHWMSVDCIWYIFCVTSSAKMGIMQCTRYIATWFKSRYCNIVGSTVSLYIIYMYILFSAYGWTDGRAVYPSCLSIVIQNSLYSLILLSFVHIPPSLCLPTCAVGVLIMLLIIHNLLLFMFPLEATIKLISSAVRKISHSKWKQRNGYITFRHFRSGMNNLQFATVMLGQGSVEFRTMDLVSGVHTNAKGTANLTGEGWRPTAMGLTFGADRNNCVWVYLAIWGITQERRHGRVSDVIVLLRSLYLWNQK